MPTSAASYHHQDHRPLQLYRVAVEGEILVVAPDQHDAENLAFRHVCDEHHKFRLGAVRVQPAHRSSLSHAALAGVPWGDPGGPTRNVSGWIEAMEELEVAAAAAAEIERRQVKLPFFAGR